MEKMKVGDFTWKDDVKSYFFTSMICYPMRDFTNVIVKTSGKKFVHENLSYAHFAR